MEICWNKEHSDLLCTLLGKLNELNIRYFILRNYKTLPDVNPSKDVDIIFEPGKMELVRNAMIFQTRWSSLL